MKWYSEKINDGVLFGVLNGNAISIIYEYDGQLIPMFEKTVSFMTYSDVMVEDVYRKYANKIVKIKKSKRYQLEFLLFIARLCSQCGQKFQNKSHSC